MSRFNMQSFVFAFTVLVLVMTTGGRGFHDVSESVSRSPIARTSLAEVAAVAPAERLPEAPSPKALASVSARAESYGAGERLPDPSLLFVHAEEALVKEVGGTGYIYEKNIHKPWPLASLTKLMTATVALNLFDAGAHMAIPQKALEVPSISGFFSVGEIFTVQDLVRAALGISSNDAAASLAEAAGRERFTEEMTFEARRIGMSETSFFDATGISSLNLGTAHDIALLAAYILKTRPELFETSRNPSFIITEQASGKARELINNNIFAGEPWFAGGKTGYTSDAKGNLLSIVEHEGRRFIIVVLGADDRFGETRTILNWLTSGV